MDTRLTIPRNATRPMALMTATDPSVFLINAPKTLLLLIIASRSPVRLSFDHYALPFHGRFGFPTSRFFGSIRCLYLSPHALIFIQSITVEAVRVTVSAIPGIKPDIMNQWITAVTLTVSGFPFVVPVYPEPVQVTAGAASLGRRLLKLKPAEVST